MTGHYRGVKLGERGNLLDADASVSWFPEKPRNQSLAGKRPPEKLAGVAREGALSRDKSWKGTFLFNFLTSQMLHK